MINYIHNPSKELLDRLFPDEDEVEIVSHPSPGDQIERALASLQLNMEEALAGRLAPAVYVISADCGTGKGVTVQKTIAGWKRRGFPGNGAVIFVATLAEVDAYVRGAGLDRNDYAVYTPDETYRTYGAGVAACGVVPVLFTTHAKAWRSLTEADTFEEASYLHYNGKARALRIWDEACIPANYAVFDLHSLMMLPAALKALGKKVVGEVDALRRACDSVVEGASVLIPETMRDLADDVLSKKFMMPEAARRTVEALGKLAGSQVYVNGCEDTNWIFIGIGRSFPSDIGPLFVLDASARLTRRYDDWSAYGMNVVHLAPALVDYSNLTIHWWNQAAGKTALGQSAERSKVFNAIIELANAKPDEDILIVMAKNLCLFDKDGRAVVPDDILNGIINPERIYLITWGRHFGLNEFSHIPNVVLVGSYQYNVTAYDAIDLAATGRWTEKAGDESRRRQQAAEFMHNVYQAVCRSRVRVQTEGVCGKANAYFIMQDTDAHRTMVRETFPNCTIEEWTPAPPRREYKRDKVLRVIGQIMEARMVVTFKEITDACGGADSSYLTKIVKDDRFKAALKAMDITIWKNKFVKSVALR